MTMIDSTTMHAELVEHGWRMNVRGHWVSPHAEDSRFVIRSLSAAWQIHHAHQRDG